MNKNKRFAISLMIPLIGLMGLVVNEFLQIKFAKKVLFEVEAFDPRHPFMGQYVRYRIKYAVDDRKFCGKNNGRQAFYLFDHKKFSFVKPKATGIVIKGICNYSGFDAGIDKYFIPEKNSDLVDKVVRSSEYKKQIGVAVRRDGRARVRDFFIDGKSLENLVFEPSTSAKKK